MKILIADDHTVVRRGLKQILAEAFPGTTFGEADNAQRTLELVRGQRWNLVILDVSMPGRGGLDVLKDIRQTRSDLPVLMMSIYPEEQYAVRALKAGASGYLTKDANPEMIVAAIGKIRDGGRYVSVGLAEKVLATFAKESAREPHESLSDRELEVMRLLAAGKNIKTIAANLSLSPKTISTYRSRLLRKLGLTNDVELLRYIIDHGL